MRKHSRSNAHQGLRDKLAEKASYLKSNYKTMPLKSVAWHMGYISGCIAAIKVELDNSYSSGRDWQSAFQDYNQAQLVWARLRVVTSSFNSGYDYLEALATPIEQLEAQ